MRKTGIHVAKITHVTYEEMRKVSGIGQSASRLIHKRGRVVSVFLH
jgi:hypothetical protein